MTVHRRRLILIVMGNVVWFAAILWLILAGRIVETHKKLTTVFLLVLVPTSIYAAAFAIRRLPEFAVSMKMLIVALLLLGGKLASSWLLGFEHPVLDWLDHIGSLLLLFSILLALFTSVRGKRRKGDTSRRQ